MSSAGEALPNSRELFGWWVDRGWHWCGSWSVCGKMSAEYLMKDVVTIHLSPEMLRFLSRDRLRVNIAIQYVRVIFKADTSMIYAIANARDEKRRRKTW
ncbi:unnamed protein product [Ceratitis capitata]|uniref:(Mediterranean fruit fly) hypothetical protein n=1 Tax=Ceratitis capitata TaxID=7213 RepID=A0A811UMX0_CERCA|nr:unnamed protein product [Ceratitis capitata]